MRHAPTFTVEVHSRRWRTLVVVASACAAAMVGTIVIADAGGDGVASGDVNGLTETVLGPPPTIFHASTGNEAKVFSESVSALRSSGPTSIVLPDGVVTVTADTTNHTLCAELTLIGGGGGHSCADSSLIATGVAYGAIGSPGGIVHVIGFVSDEVDSVVVNGEKVSVTANTWTFTGAQSTPITFTVSSTSTGVRVTL